LHPTQNIVGDNPAPGNKNSHNMPSTRLGVQVECGKHKGIQAPRESTEEKTTASWLEAKSFSFTNQTKPFADAAKSSRAVTDVHESDNSVS
jgi:hypothetical protein